MKRFRTNVLSALLGVALFVLPASAGAAEDLADLLVKKGTITKEEAEALQSRSISSAVDKITFYGDLRIREEGMWFAGDDNDTKNKNRQRFRLRIGSDITEGPFVVHLRLASGGGEQVSTNQSFQDLSSQKPFWIDRAYVEYMGVPGLNLAAGRMANPFFTNFTSELVWDDDYNPEGFAEQYSMKIGDQGKVFARIGQIVLDGGDQGAAAQWLLGYQAGTEIKTDAAGFNAAVMYYNLANGTQSDFGQADQEGNTRSTGKVLANPFNVVGATGAVTIQAGFPVTISGDVAMNLADTVQDAALDIEDETLGFEIGLKLGNASAAKTSEVGYAYRSIETDATLADLNDSDFGPDGGTNRKGHSVWAAYNPTKSTQLKLKYFNSQVKNEDLPPAPVISTADPNPAFHRVQLDFSIKF